MNKRAFGIRYLHIVRKPLFFYSVLLLGIALFLYLTLTTQILTDMGSQTLLSMIFIKAGRGL